MKSVCKAVFPIISNQYEFFPISKSVTKELLPVFDKPLIQFALDEAFASGIRELIFTSFVNLNQIEDYLSEPLELKEILRENGQIELIQKINSLIPSYTKCSYIHNAKSRTLEEALLSTESIVGNEPFAVILTDDLIDAQKPAIGQLIEAREKMGGGNILAVQNVPKADTKKYGIVGVNDDSLTTSLVHEMVEKPDPEVAPSTLAVIGRYVLEPEIFERLKKVQKGVGGEIQLTDAIASQLDLGKTYAHRFDGIRYDCGSKQGFLDATIRFARKAGYAV